MALIGRGKWWGLGWRLLLPPLLLIGLASCVDPTEDAFPVSIVNDSAQTITLKQCDSACQAVYNTYTVSAGSSVSVNATSENLDEYFSVTTSSGTRLGCLDLKYQTKQPNVRVPVSSAKACPQPGAAATSGSSWWSDVLVFIYFAVVGIFGFALMSFSLVRTYDRWRNRGRNPVLAGLAGGVVAVLMLAGGWLVVAVYRGIRWTLRRTQAATATP